MMMKPLLVLGVGNYILSDEGVGIHTVKRLESDNVLPADADIMDGATGGYFLLKDVVSYENIIIVDATLDSSPAGSIKVLRPRFSDDFPPLLSAHEFGLKHLVDALYILELPVNVTLITVSVKNFQKVGIGLSAEVEAAIPELCRLIRELSEQILGLSESQSEACLLNGGVG